MATLCRMSARSACLSAPRRRPERSATSASIFLVDHGEIVRAGLRHDQLGDFVELLGLLQELVGILQHRIDLGQQCGNQCAKFVDRGLAGLHVDLDLVFGCRELAFGAVGQGDDRFPQRTVLEVEIRQALLGDDGQFPATCRGADHRLECANVVALVLLDHFEADADPGLGRKVAQVLQVNVADRLELRQILRDLLDLTALGQAAEDRRAHSHRVVEQRQALREQRRRHLRQGRHRGADAVDECQSNSPAQARQNRHATEGEYQFGTERERTER